MALMFWTRRLSRRERFVRLFTWPYIRQTRLLAPAVEWWWNRG